MKILWTHSCAHPIHIKLHAFVWHLKQCGQNSSRNLARENFLDLLSGSQNDGDRVGCLVAVLRPSKRPLHGARDWWLAAVRCPLRKPWQLLFSSFFYSSFWTLLVQMGIRAAEKDEHWDKCLRSGDQGWRNTATLTMKPGFGLALIFNQLWSTLISNTQYHWPAGLQPHWGSCFHQRSPTSTSWRTWEGRYCSVHQRKWGHIL